MTGAPSGYRLAALEGLAPGLKPIAVDTPLDLWLFDHTAPFDSELLSWLSEEERSNARRFHFPWHRRRYLATHATLRGLIADRTGIPPSALCFDCSADGKPSLRGKNSLHFSISYSAGLSLIGIGAGRAMGVDIEQERIIHDADELAELYFTPLERRILSRTEDESERSLAFLHGWTRKEACLKALGTGLSYPASCLETDLSGRRTTVQLPSAMLGETASFVVAHHVISWARILPQSGPVIAEQASRSG
jgi:4'-phosphopantetheinyl transferase